MVPFQHILVPTDFSPPAREALDMAVQFATACDARLTLLHVYEPPEFYMYSPAIYWPTADLAREAQKALDGALADLKERYPRAEAMLETGKPADRILDVAKDKKADLIVMGTHGRKGLSHVFLGSVAEKVVRRSPIPVLTLGLRAERHG